MLSLRNIIKDLAKFRLVYNVRFFSLNNNNDKLKGFGSESYKFEDNPDTLSKEVGKEEEKTIAERQEESKSFGEQSKGFVEKTVDEVRKAAEKVKEKLGIKSEEEKERKDK